VRFNPSEYTLTHASQFAELNIPGLNQPLLQFVRGQATTLSLEVFLDRTDDRESISDDITTLRKTVKIDGELHAPPIVCFEWGDTRFAGVVTSLRERFVLFDRQGGAQRARVQLEMKSYQSVEDQLQDPPRRSPDRTRTWVVRTGDRLDQIARREYGDPRHWRVLAEANGLERTRALQPGQVLLLPSL